MNVLLIIDAVSTNIMNANKTNIGLLRALIRCAVCLVLLVLSLPSVACEPSANQNITADMVESVKMQHLSDNSQYSPHKTHSDCDGKCCDYVCECKLGSCFNLTTMVAPDLKSISAPSSSHFYFSNFYHFYSGFSLLRPPKVHLIS